MASNPSDLRPFGSSTGSADALSSSAQAFGQTARSQTEQLGSKVTDALDRGREGISSSAAAAGGDLTDDMSRLRADMMSMKETLAKFAAEAGGEAARTARTVGQAVVDQVGSAATSLSDAGADVASSAKEHAKTFATELESAARKNPLGALAGAVLVGVVIGMMSRGRS